MLIVFRGFPYTHRQTGTYVFLFFQNLTNIIALCIILLNMYFVLHKYKNEIICTFFNKYNKLKNKKLD